jgi:hypothetical protein
VLVVYPGTAEEAQALLSDADPPAPPPPAECLTPQTMAMTQAIVTAVYILVVNV